MSATPVRPAAAPLRATNILVARGGAIGDFVLTLPVFAALRAAYPGAQIAVLGSRAVAGLAVAGGLADAVHELGAREFACLFGGEAAVSSRLGLFFSRFNIIVSYLCDPGRVFEANVRRLTAARFIRGPHRPDEQGGQHATEALLEPLAALGIRDVEPAPRLRLPRSRARRRRLVAHPGSGSESKNWPVEHWAVLLQRLGSATDWDLLLVGGEADIDRLGRLQDHWPTSRCEIALGLPLVELAARMASGRGFIGHDSGITHLAAALGLPGVVLWGPSSERVWRPRSERMVLVTSPDGLASLPVERVAEACYQLMAGRAPRYAVKGNSSPATITRNCV
jgi:ADP-heptose:LPS heptosyltransferase